MENSGISRRADVVVSDVLKDKTHLSVVLSFSSQTRPFMLIKWLQQHRTSHLRQHLPGRKREQSVPPFKRQETFSRSPSADCPSHLIPSLRGHTQIVFGTLQLIAVQRVGLTNQDLLPPGTAEYPPAPVHYTVPCCTSNTRFGSVSEEGRAGWGLQQLPTSFVVLTK